MDKPKRYEVQMTEEQWQEKLSPQQYDVLRRHGTEMRGESLLNKEKRDGKYFCAGCGAELFESGAKFDSGTGWPSFDTPMPSAVGTTVDRSHFMTRVEVHCQRCGGHLGHVFDDGPTKSGMRYCVNGAALKFEEK